MQQRTGKAHCTVPPVAGLVGGAREKAGPRGPGRGGSPAAAARLQLGLGADRGTWPRRRPRPPAEHRPDFPPSRGRRPAPRGSESRRRRRGRRMRWGRGRATSARRVGRTKRQRRRRRELFSVSAPRSLQRLLTEAGSAVLEKVGARQRPRPGAGASEASRASHEPARPRPFLLPSLPSRLEAGGRGAGARGRGRAARAGPAGSCSSPPRAVGGSGSEGARGGSANPQRSPPGARSAGLSATGRTRCTRTSHFAVPLGGRWQSVTRGDHLNAASRVEDPPFQSCPFRRSRGQLSPNTQSYTDTVLHRRHSKTWRRRLHVPVFPLVHLNTGALPSLPKERSTVMEPQREEALCVKL